MPTGVNDAAITTNDLLTAFMPEMARKVDEQDRFSQFFKKGPKPTGHGTVVNYVVESGNDEAARRAPGSHRRSKQRKAYEINVNIPDELRESRQIVWEKIRQGRIDEVSSAVYAVEQAMVRARMRTLGAFLMTNAAQNSGTPTDPAAAAAGETAHWWNTNDTEAPPSYGENSFSAGHDHVETGAADAITADRLRDDLLKQVMEHGYGEQGMVAMVNLAEEQTILKFANVAQSNQTMAPTVREMAQQAFDISALDGYLGLRFFRSNWVPAGALPGFDANLAGLAPYGGAIMVEDLPFSPNKEDDEDTRSTWIEASEQWGAGILHKGAGAVLHVA